MVCVLLKFVVPNLMKLRIRNLIYIYIWKRYLLLQRRQIKDNHQDRENSSEKHKRNIENKKNKEKEK